MKTPNFILAFLNLDIHKKLFLINMFFGSLAIISWLIAAFSHAIVFWPWIFNIAQFTTIGIQWWKIKQQRKKYMENRRI